MSLFSRLKKRQDATGQDATSESKSRTITIRVEEGPRPTIEVETPDLVYMQPHVGPALEVVRGAIERLLPEPQPVTASEILSVLAETRENIRVECLGSAFQAIDRLWSDVEKRGIK